MIPQYRPLIDRETLAKETSDYILGDGFFTEFKHTQAFEKALADLLQVKHCSVVNNGTLSLSLALHAHGIKPGDSVLVPNITMIATSNAVKFVGARPFFIDIDPVTLCMDLKKATDAVEMGFVKAVMYVTFNGRSHSPKQLEMFKKVCDFFKVAIIQDNAQSLGSCLSDGSPISCLEGGIGSFSFSMPKIITTGQGGCLVTNDDILGDKLKKLKDFGRTGGGMDIHDEFGINSKFTEQQAIMGLNQLRTIKQRVYQKKYIYSLYKYHLFEERQVHFPDTATSTICPWFVDVYLPKRDELSAYLKTVGIGTRVMYPELTSQKVNHSWTRPNHKIAKQVAENGLWLPSSMDLQSPDIEMICRHIKDFYAK